MKLNLPKFERLHILIITLLVLLVPFSLYYWGFVRLQTTYFTEHKSRQLAVMGNQIGAKLKNLSGVVQNASLQLFERVAEAKKNRRPLEDSALNEFRKTLAISDRLELQGAFLPALPKSADAKPSLKSLTFKPERETDISRLVIEFTVGWNDNSPAQSLQVDADLGGVLQSILGKEVFDSVLIADAESGVVIHQHNRQSGSKLRVATLDALRDEQKNKVDHLALAQATNIQDIKLAGNDYKLFSRPVEMGIAVAGSERPGLRWIVCGLISEGQFRREQMAISYTVLIVFTVVMILAALSWSFLKLWLMGAKDRLRVADVYFLFFSAMIGAALLTLFSLYIYKYISISHEVDDKLEAFAQDVHDNLHAEVRAALDELDKFNEDLVADPASRALLAASMPQNPRPRLSPQADNGRRAGGGAKGAVQPETLKKTHILPGYILKQEREAGIEHPYPFFATAFWVDEERRQRIKWTTRDAATRFITLPQARAYFNNIKEERFLHLMKGKVDRPAPRDGETEQERACREDNERAAHHDFWLEPITSPLAGIESVIITKKLCAPYSAWVAALDTRLLSMLETVTPPGYGFSVIEANGRVLFHSKLAQHFEENFYDECDERAELRAAVEARQSKEISADYLGSGHTLYTLPVTDFPGWTIITYRDKQILRTMQLELLVVAANLFLLYSLLLLLFFVLCYFWNLNTSERIEWLWPRDEAITVYRRVLLGNVAFCLLLGAAIFSLERQQLLALAVLLPVAGLAVAGVSLKLNGMFRKSGTGRNDNAPVANCRRAWYQSMVTAYVSMFTTLLFLTSVLPAIAFFKIAYDEQMKLLAKHGQVKLAEDLRAREERIRAQYAGYARNLTSETTRDPALAKDNGLEELLGRRPDSSPTDKPRPLDIYESIFLLRPQYAGYARNLVSKVMHDTERTKGEWVERLIGRRLEWSPAGKPRPLDVYESVFLDTRPETASADAGRSLVAAPARTTGESSAASSRFPKAASFEEYLSYLRPLVNRTSGEWAGLLNTRSADGVWEWSTPEEKRLRLQTRETDVAEHAAPLRLSSNVPFLRLPLPGHSLSSTLWWLSLVAILGLLFLLIRFVVVRVFLLKLDDPMMTLYARDFHDKKAPKKQFVVLGAPFLDVRWLLNGSAVKRITMQEAVLKKAAATQHGEAEQNGDLLAIDNFDYRSDDPEWNLNRLELLESLQQDSRPVIIFSRHDPFRFCLAPSCATHQSPSNGAFAADAPDRWMNVISSYWVIHIEDTGERQAFIKALCEKKQQQKSLREEERKQKSLAVQADRSFAPRLRKRSARLRNGDGRLAVIFNKLTNRENPLASLYDALADECEPRTYLQNVGREILNHSNFDNLTSEQLVRLLVEQADAYYKAMWATCTADQKLTLYYLAQDNLVSAKNVEVRRLMRRGLIVRDPDVRLMNESFRQFVLSTVVPDEIGAGVRTGSSWSKLRLPLLLILVCIALFLLVTHPEMYSSSMAIITALATGIPAVFQLLGMFQRGKSATQLAQLPTGGTPPVV
ncbi:MAG TPA: hypothetical protein VF527_01550 [Pyrinomonadaceae bacterium]|jgi:hypothetical protein